MSWFIFNCYQDVWGFGDTNTYFESGFYSFWRVWKHLRFFRMYKIAQKLANYEDLSKLANNDKSYDDSNVVRYRLFTVISNMLIFVLLSAGLMSTANDMIPSYFHIGISYETEFNFDAAVYFCIITITTVGYGDMSPTTTYSRMIVGVYFLIAIIFYTKQTSELTDLTSQLAGKSMLNFSLQAQGYKHVVLTSSSLNILKLFRFIREFFHPDHDIVEAYKLVII